MVEAGRHYGWRNEARTNESVRNYTLRNVGTVNARNVTIAGNYDVIEFHGTHDPKTCDIAAGQARLFMVAQAFGDIGGNIDITWTPDLLDAEPMTWTETPPMAPFLPLCRISIGITCAKSSSAWRETAEVPLYGGQPEAIVHASSMRRPQRSKNYL
ncbi:hypothetical protein [Mycolicibacterium stellerae]|uniref:hypothetical protein n=1 Tax=Mycolicibacterium stellerae TaxID=2358193 RepID=UPI0013DD9E49|nr:hypothetical protein [Mycolicibacterium stellerae]